MAIYIRFASGGFGIGLDPDEIKEKEVKLDRYKRIIYVDKDE